MPDQRTGASPRVTLTFDNGPTPDVTPHVLDVLGEREIRATFFVTGERLSAAGALPLAGRAHAEGHWIGNHTWSHSRPLGEIGDDAEVRREIEQTQSLLGELAHPDRLFRPMGGGGNLDQRLFNSTALRVLQEGEFSAVLWNAIPRDWIDPRGWLPRALDMCRDGALMVLHDTATGAMELLERFLDEALARGVTFVQALPDDCVPIRRGELVGSLDGLVSAQTS